MTEAQRSLSKLCLAAAVFVLTRFYKFNEAKRGCLKMRQLFCLGRRISGYGAEALFDDAFFDARLRLGVLSNSAFLCGLLCKILIE